MSALCLGELGCTSASSNSSQVKLASGQESKLAKEEVERRRRADDETKRVAVKELIAEDRHPPFGIQNADEDKTNSFSKMISIWRSLSL